MNNIIFSPLFRNAVGIGSLLNHSDRRLEESRTSPYNIVKLDDESYEISIAATGFSRDEIEVMQQANTLLVHAKHEEMDSGDAGKKNPVYLHQGLSEQPIELKFELANNTTIEGARLENGVLVVDLKRTEPEHLRPRSISIQAA